MEYIENGQTLQSLIADKLKKGEDSCFSKEQVIDWFTQLCLAVKYCHDKKVIHGNI